MWTLLLLLSSAAAASNHGAIKGPPVAETKELTQIARLGEEARLVCPLSGHPAPIVHWTKDGEAVDSFAWDRFRAAKRSLKVTDVAREDTGVFVCKGTNGFGSEEIRINLIVIDPSDFPDLGPGELPEVAPPVLTEDTLMQKSAVAKRTGDSLRLTCQALGKPQPEVTWLRNGVEVRGQGRTGGHATTVLFIKDLMEADSATYTCQARNVLGVASRNFSVVVEGAGMDHPVLPDGPDNTTVQAGAAASLECRVRSSTEPTIKWLKRLEPSESSSASGDVIDLGDDKFRIIQRGGFVGAAVTHVASAEYVNRLEIAAATEADAGMYLCFVTNLRGYKFKNAFLTVVPKSFSSGNNNDNSSSSNNPSSPDNGPVLAAVVCLSVLAFFFLVAILACAYKKRSKTPTTAPSVTSAESRDVQETLVRHVGQPYANNNIRNMTLHVNKLDTPLPPAPPPSTYYVHDDSNSYYGGNTYEVPHVYTGGASTLARYEAQGTVVYPYRSQNYYGHYGD